MRVHYYEHVDESDTVVIAFHMVSMARFAFGASVFYLAGDSEPLQLPGREPFAAFLDFCRRASLRTT